ncbi:hypothetical protein CRYUN_Cryun12cG0134700 [Craigia yunnanensis]
MLKQQMEVAAKSEDYKEAARIRDSLKMFEEEEPVLRLRRLIKKAVADERYRDQLKEIAPHYLLKCSSDATTLGGWCYRRTASYSFPEQEGDFEMEHIDKAGSPSFSVAITPFSLSTMGDDVGTF